MTKQFLVVFQTGDPLLVIRWIALQNPILTDDAAVHFAIPQFVSELRFVGRTLPALNNCGVRFKQTDNFLCGGHLFLLKHAPGGLVNHLADQRQIVLKRFG
jgi:hypothetical protein